MRNRAGACRSGRPTADDFFVGVAAGDAIWVWREDTANSTLWRLGSSSARCRRAGHRRTKVDGLVYLRAGRRGSSRLRTEPAQCATWPLVGRGTTRSTPRNGANVVTLKSIVPILDDEHDSSATARWWASRRQRAVSGDDHRCAVRRSVVTDSVDPDVAPVAAAER